MPTCQHGFLHAWHLDWLPQTHARTHALAMQMSVCVQVQQMMVAANFEPTDTVWGSLMVACGQAGQLETALTLWQAFKRARGGLWNMKNAEPWCAMLIACAHTYHLQPALTVMSDMRQAGDPVCWVSLSD